MATLKETFDPEVLTRITEEMNREAKRQNAPQEKPKVTKRELKNTEEDTELFSALFWKPKYIPDIPVRVYKDTDWHEVARVMIPEPNKHWVWPKEATEYFALAMYMNDTTLLHGLQGTGKSELPAQWCAKLRIPMWRMSCHEETREVHFLGSPSIEYDEEGKAYIKQESTMLTDSIKYGGYFVEDEAFRHSAALVLQALREKNTRTIILPDAPGRTAEERVLRADPTKWRYILTDNTAGGGDTLGVFQAQVQDASTLDRITAAIEIDYLDPKDEANILKNHTEGLNDRVIDDMIQFAGLVRKEFRAGGMRSTLSVRALLAWAEKTEILGSTKEGLRLSWASKLGDPNDKVRAADMFHQVFAERL